MKPRQFAFLLPWIFLFALGGCAGVPAAKQRTDHADRIAGQHGWRLLAIPAGRFTLASYVPGEPVRAGRLTVYIEGDGMAWVSASQPSLDPTPVMPVALELALRQHDGAAAYLARPCQFIKDDATCGMTYWTNRRFAPEVIESTNLAIDQLKQRFGASQIELVGYSGGGAVAALAAARRQDIVRLVTVAGNLDTVAWSRLHRETPLRLSLNPADEWQALQGIPQTHFVGELDENITPDLVRSYAARFPDKSDLHVEVVTGFTHACCWTRDWPTLARERLTEN